MKFTVMTAQRRETWMMDVFVGLADGKLFLERHRFA
jgi:hypothetical protein